MAADPAASRRLLGRRARRATRSSKANIFCCWPISASSTASGAQGRGLSSAAQLPDGGWAMYPGGRADVNVSVKAYFALKLTGHDAESRAHAPGPRYDPAAWGRGRRQQLHAFLPGAVGTDSVRPVPGGAGRNAAAAEMVSGEYLPDELLVADDPGSAGHHVGVSARCAADRNSRASSNCS